MTRILTWNIRQGGGNRVPSILANIDKHASDIVVLTEYRNNKQGDTIRKHFKRNGFSFVETSSIDAQQNSILVASKEKPLSWRTCNESGVESFRCLEVAFESFYLVGCYFAQKNLKIPLWEYLIAFAKANVSTRAIILGDFNTGKHFYDEVGRTFHCSDSFEQLSQIGWYDAWRYFAQDRREYSWFGSKSGFRLDHFFLSPPLLPFLTSCSYSHAERMTRVSDHSSLMTVLSI